MSSYDFQIKCNLLQTHEECSLGKLVKIRSCTDENELKYYTKEQKEIRNEWLERFKDKSEKSKSCFEIMDDIFESMSQ